MPAPSAIADKPESEPEYMHSITPTSTHAPLFLALCADPIPEPEHALSPFPSTTSCIDITPELERMSESSFPPPGLALPSTFLSASTHSAAATASTPLPQPSIIPSASIPTDLDPFPVRPTMNDEPDIETKTEIETEAEPEIETEKENVYTSPPSLVVPPLPLSSIPSELENQEQPEHESASQAVPVELPLVAHRQSLVFEDPDLKFFPANTTPLGPSESLSEQREPFPTLLKVSNAPDPPQLTSQDQMLGAASLDPDSSLLTPSVSSMLARVAPSGENTKSEALYLPPHLILLKIGRAHV